MHPSEQRDGQTAVLLGASGLVGGFCLDSLLAAVNYSRILLLGRRQLSIAEHPRLVQKTVNFDSLTVDDFIDSDDIFCALGTTIRNAGSKEAYRLVDLNYPLEAARLARRAGARQFILVSSVGTDAHSKNFYLRTKGALEQALDELGFDALHIFRPSLLLGKRKEFRPGERVMIALAPVLNLTLWGGLRRYRAIPAATVGKAMVGAAQAGNKGKSIYEYDQIIQLAG